MKIRLSPAGTREDTGSGEAGDPTIPELGYRGSGRTLDQGTRRSEMTARKINAHPKPRTSKSDAMVVTKLWGPGYNWKAGDAKYIRTSGIKFICAVQWIGVKS